ncbi:Bet1-like SNARE 1-1 [Glycine soja]
MTTTAKQTEWWRLRLVGTAKMATKSGSNYRETENEKALQSSTLELISLESYVVLACSPLAEICYMSWHKGLHDSDILVTNRYHRPLHLGPLSLTIKHSVSPEVGVHGIPMNNFSHSLSRGVRLSELSMGLITLCLQNLIRPKPKQPRFHFTHHGGRSISTDRDGFQLTSSGGPSDNMIVISQECRYEDESDHGFTNCPDGTRDSNSTHLANLLMCLSCITALSTRMSGGTVMGSFAPYQAFAVGGPSSVRGYGEGAVGVGQSCLVSTSELSSIPLCSLCKSTVKGRSHSSITSSYGDGNDASTHTVSLDAGGIRFKTRLAQIQVDYVINAFQHGTTYFGISDLILDGRNNRVALFDGIEEGGIRASSLYSSTSSHEIDEHDNEQALDGLQDRVNLLKRLSGDINEEVDSHNRMLDRMGNDMDSSRGVLSGTMDKFKMVFETKSSRRMFSLVASFVVLFLIIYYLTR